MSNSIALLSTGDIFLEDATSFDLLEPLAPVIRQADIAIGNLEGPVSLRGQPSPEKVALGSRNSLRMRPEVVHFLRKCGFDAVSLANNHGMDYGPDALTDTLDLLDSEGIKRAGGGRSLAEASTHAVIEHAGIRIALLSMTWVFGPVSFPARQSTPGLFCMRTDTSYMVPRNLMQVPGLWPRAVTATREEDKALALSAVETARADADIVIAACHWGISGSASASAMGLPAEWGPTFLTDYQKDMGHAIIDAGADMIVGHHPHRLQAFELYKGKLIAYSVGNLVFSYKLKSFGMTGAMIASRIDPKTKSFQEHSIIPLRMGADRYTTHLAAGDEIAAVAGELTDLSRPFGTTFTIKENRILVQG